MTDFTLNIADENLDDISVRRFPLEFRRISPICSAKEGDIVAMAVRYDVDFCETGIEHQFMRFWQCVKGGVKAIGYGEVPRNFADHAAHLIVDNIFFAAPPHDLALQGMVVDPVGYKLDVVFFSDAVLVVNTDWLIDDYFDDRDQIFPVHLPLDESSRTDPRYYLALTRVIFGRD